jgi:hypothetical protein
MKVTPIITISNAFFILLIELINNTLNIHKIT